ncbi:MAG: histidine phosphatase family protein [Acidobacteriota bacterium]
MRSKTLLPVWCLVVALTGVGCSSRTFVVTRHAEKTSPVADALSTEGLARATELAEVLSRAKVQRIVVTNTCRSAQTGQALAESLGIPLTVQQLPGGAGFDGCVPPVSVPTVLLPTSVVTSTQLVEHLLDDYQGTTLIVGHSNTVGPFITAFGGGTIAPFAETEHDRLYVLTRRFNGKPIHARRVDGRYGVAFAP